ncbi:NAD(P)-binding domain-containing protein [Lysobacter gummosus]|uniref:NAD(P)-binding domain-containing protein n=1 Tax=Lysobacter gummosus TaxID=262324 RepID=UPI0036428204
MIAIIGAGPSGIALGASLDRRHLSYDLFEARSIGATWKAAPASLRVLSPWWTNVLTAGEVLRGNPLRKPRADEYLDHLLRLAGRLHGTLHESCKVLSLSRNEQGLWTVHSEQGQRGPYTAIVLATGYFFSPSWPCPSSPSDGTVPILHAADIHDYAQLDGLRAGDAPVVVVGRRVTAGQLMLEMHSRNIPCALSLRSPIEYRRHGFIATLREAAYFFWEELQSRMKPGIRRFSYPVMDGGKTRNLVDSGRIAIWPTIERIEEGHVVFGDGTKQPAAAVVMATGYRATLDLLPPSLTLDEYGVPLHRGFEVQGLPGIYLLGFDNLYDHRSRYLRGIRFDATRLANTLQARLTPTN